MVSQLVPCVARDGCGAKPCLSGSLVGQAADATLGKSGRPCQLGREDIILAAAASSDLEIAEPVCPCEAGLDRDRLRVRGAVGAGLLPAFRAVFCRRMSWATSYKIAVAEEGAGSLFPLGGAGSLALGVWALRRGGMPGDEIARKTVAFFLLTSVPSVGLLLLLGVGLATGILPGGGGVLLTALPTVVAAGAIAATLASRRLARGAEARIRRHGEGSRWVRLAPALSATADGVDEALHQLRQANPLLLVGLVGYLVFDMLVFWASFRAVGASPELAPIWMAYLIGQLGNWLPIPGGIGGTELGLVGALVLYGLPAVTATAAVLLYRVIELWIPAVLGLAAFVQLRLLLRRETDAIKLCKPGDTVEIVGLGPATVDRSTVKSTASTTRAPAF